MNNDTIQKFVHFYLSTFNNKDRHNEFIKLWKEYSTLVHDMIPYTKEPLCVFLTQLYKVTIVYQSEADIQCSHMIIGDRRANILLSYKILDTDNTIKVVSQYIQLAYSNNKEYWIHSCLLNIK